MYCTTQIKKCRPLDPPKNGEFESYFETCRGPVKPEITFFGESLPKKFMEVYERIDSECDLLIVIGTALAVNPFASIVD